MGRMKELAMDIEEVNQAVEEVKALIPDNRGEVDAREVERIAQAHGLEYDKFLCHMVWLEFRNEGSPYFPAEFFPITKRLETMIDEAGKYEDGETGMVRCMEMYCLDKGISKTLGDKALELWWTRSAQEAGIPMSVIKGKTKLTDHFSQEYIDFQANKKTKGSQ
jgi:hypothetical protein